jgi:16S rRNA (cytosine1402-N4)-methyltransferase
LAIDRDPEAIEAARAVLREPGVQLLNASFASQQALDAIADFAPDFVLLDLGVSGHQLDSTERGFSFRAGAPLDMRMSAGFSTTAAELLNSLDRAGLERVFREYGDERKASRLAAVIARRRAARRLETSDDLVNAVRETLGPRSGPSDFARLFQAVRMELNDEIGQLELGLPAILELLSAGGSIAVISYHSGEDRVVKRLFREWGRDCVCPPRVPTCTCRGRKLGFPEPRKPIRPTAAEVAANPRARSAKLRVFRKADEVQG